MSPQLAQHLREQLASAGASIVEFADLSILVPEVRHWLPIGMSIAVALNPQIASGISSGPTLEYGEEYDRVNALLDRLGALCAELLQAEGHRAVFVATTSTHIDRAALSTMLPHKTAATRAGLGWIGKCALLVTERYGSALRLTTVLTDAPLPVGKPVETSRCGGCTECVDKCPGSAPTGKHWQEGLRREGFYDAFACAETARSLSQAIGLSHSVCGICIAACPWTQAYLSRSLPRV